MATATSPSRPRFRSDLVAEPIDEDGQRYIDVIDPDTGATFRFYEVEYSLACAMDGERDVAGLVTWAQEELGITPTSMELASVIATLGDLGYLDGGVAVGVGVVAPAQMRPRPASDIELGFAGPAAGERPGLPLPPDEDFGLGSPGPGKSPQTLTGLGGPAPLRPRSQDIQVEVDLSNDLAVPIRADDVKEAVRQSKVMRAAEMPSDVQATLDSARASARAQGFEPSPPVTPREPLPAAGKKAKPAKEQPRQTQKVRTQQPPTMDAVESISPVLLGLLVLVLLGAGGFAFWKYYWSKRNVDAGAHTSSEPVVREGSGSAGKPPRPPSPAITATIALSTPAAVPVASPADGDIKTMADDGAVVNQGDLLATLDGTDRILGQVRAMNKEIDRVTRQREKYKADLAEAEERKSASGVRRATAKIKDREDSLARKQAKKATYETDLEKYVIRAPAGGVVKVATPKGKAVATSDVVATIQPPASATATFALPPGRTFQAADPVQLSIKAPAEGQPATLACTVSEIAGARLVVACPADGTVPDGATVVLP